MVASACHHRDAAGGSPFDFRSGLCTCSVHLIPFSTRTYADKRDICGTDLYQSLPRYAHGESIGFHAAPHSTVIIINVKLYGNSLSQGGLMGGTHAIICPVRSFSNIPKHAFGVPIPTYVRLRHSSLFGFPGRSHARGEPKTPPPDVPVWAADPIRCVAVNKYQRYATAPQNIEKRSLQNVKFLYN
jgi:hypothetical protein